MSKWLLAVITGGLIALSGPAQAAEPQILALLETVQPAEMICDAANCQVELSSFCLQQDRRAPLHGTHYVIAEGGAVDLVLTGAKGETRHIAARDHVKLTSVRGFTAITATLPRQAMAELGATSAAVTVGKKVSLIPVGPTIPSNYAEEDETKRATSTLRTVGHKVMENAGSGIASIHAMNALINYMPTADLARVTTPDALWQVAVTERLPEAGASELAAGREAFDDCAASFMSLSGVGLQRCLQIRHDAMLEKMTHKFWQILGAGS